jgi:acetyl esterase/lipase
LLSPALFPADSFEGLPPVYSEITGQDPFRDDGLLYIKQLERANVKTKVKVYPGMPHAFFEYPMLEETKNYVPALTEGVQWVLQQKSE